MLDMFFLAPCAPAVNAKVGTHAQQRTLLIPPGLGSSRDVTTAALTTSTSERGAALACPFRATPGHCTCPQPQAILAWGQDESHLFRRSRGCA
jgi:hypothetical protein